MVNFGIPTIMQPEWGMLTAEFTQSVPQGAEHHALASHRPESGDLLA